MYFFIVMFIIDTYIICSLSIAIIRITWIIQDKIFDFFYITVSTVYPDPLGRGRSLYDSSSPKSCEDFYRPYQLFQPSRQEDIQLPSASQRQVSHAPATSSSTSPFYSPFSSTLSAEAPAFVQHFRKFAPFTTPLHSQPQAGKFINDYLCIINYEK